MLKLKKRIATIGSHSALQILKGAQDEGFETICVCEKKRTAPYKMFPVADEIIEIDSFKNFLKVEKELIKRDAIVIPHGSFVEYLGPKKIQQLKVPHYGNKKILDWESDRVKQQEWLTQAKIKMPKIFEKPEEIDRPVIVKFHGARGGRGYFLANSTEEFYKKIAKHPDEKFTIQEYVVGVPIYVHYFYSRLTGELEIMGFDKRYESNADSIGRVAAADQITTNLQTSYTIVGNIPLVVRESLLPYFIKIGQRVIEESQKLEPPGLFGPFCLEGIVTSDLVLTVFEISARIVAGTNPYVAGSPYTFFKYNEPMSTGRRIARDIKMAIEQNRMDKVFN
ncbi:formate--phosphoribosylaminoimidazolecarboxamide ligase [Candidatus Gracilibacteria bacterium]|nr:formate--phosphoribosylaminoimidazolecarboxamide ligase [Candidatus Gracilibacteria bacterium]MCF7856647.1 formate--phosphoribosylaminoimidazolecarboxamide ligase [Candidatus Gracilibacteria bacterium]MCF7896964.1 formate--phosphoribosylaminoimidazolecarboxamide ligase [Candidatus Gracilibacteria bacterium]